MRKMFQRVVVLKMRIHFDSEIKLFSDIIKAMVCPSKYEDPEKWRLLMSDKSKIIV